MTISPSDYRLGCLICADPRKDEWFAQIVEPWTPGMFGFRVAATAIAIGREAVLAKVCEFVGIKDVPPVAMRTATTPYDMVQTGLTAAVKRCENAVGFLVRRLRSERQLGEAIDDLIEELKLW
jgi:hypothetical protein